MVESRQKDLLKVLEAIAKRRAKRVSTTAGVSGRRNEILTSAGQGRYVKYRQAADGRVSDIAVLPTIKAAIMRSPGKKKVKIKREDFREKIRRKKTSSLICLVMDASSSMLSEGKAATAKAIIHELLLDVYQKRDRLALVLVILDLAPSWSALLASLVLPVGQIGSQYNPLVPIPTWSPSRLVPQRLSVLSFFTARQVKGNT